jgi:hypothetical protein
MSYSAISSLLHSPLHNRLDSLTLGIIKCFTFGMYRKLQHSLQLKIMKYILSKKLNKKINLIKKKIGTARYLTDYEIREYTFSHEAPPREELLIRFIKGEKVNYNDLVLVNTIFRFDTKFLELFKDYYYNGRLPSHSESRNRRENNTYTYKNYKSSDNYNDYDNYHVFSKVPMLIRETQRLVLDTPRIHKKWIQSNNDKGQIHKQKSFRYKK